MFYMFTISAKEWYDGFAAKMSKFEDLKKRFDEGEDPVDKAYLALMEQQKNG